MYRWILTLAATATLGTTAWGQTTLSVGDVRIVGMNTSGSDGFSFVLTRDVSANTVLKFTDGGLQNTAGTTMLSTENFLNIRFNAAATAGTLVRVIDPASTAGNILASSSYGSGTFSSAGTLSGLSGSGDQLFVYQGSGFTAGGSVTASDANIAVINSGSQTFNGSLLYGVNNQTWLTTGTADSNNSYLPTVLAGDNSLLARNPGRLDNFEFAGVRTGLTNAFQRATLSNVSNFTSSASNITLSTTGFTFTTSADLFWDNNGTGAGTGGAGTWDSTTNNRFKNAATDGGTTTYARWIDRSTNNEHTAVFAGTAGTVDVSGTVVPSNIRFVTTGYNLTGGTINLTAASPTITVNTGTATIGSTINGSNGFAKSGTGTLILTAANTYSGSTNIDAGRLTLSGSGSIASSPLISLGNAATLTVSGLTGGANFAGGQFSLASGQTLIGAGFVEGNATVGSGSFLRSGLSSTELAMTFGDNLNIVGTLTARVFGTGSTEIGRADVLGNTTVDSNARIALDLSVVDKEALRSAVGLGNTRTYTILNGVGTVGAFTLANLDFIGLDGYSAAEWSIVGSPAAGTVQLTFTPVPEPATILGLSAGVLAFGGFVRRRRNGR